MFNTLKHVWNKVYCDVDIPTDRSTECTLDLKTALKRFFLPRTNRLNESVPRTTGTWFFDIVLFVPRLALNFLKLVTEVLTLSLREWVYAAFLWMIEKKTAASANWLSKKLAQVGAGLFWVLTTLLGGVYFVGSYLTSPIETTRSIWKTFHALGYPRIGYAISAVPATLFYIIPTLLIFFVSPIFVPTLFAAMFPFWSLLHDFMFINNGPDPKNPARNYTIEAIDELPESDSREENVIYIKKEPVVISSNNEKDYHIYGAGYEKVSSLPENKDMEIGINYYVKNENDTYQTKLKTYECAVKGKAPIQLKHNAHYISALFKEDPTGGKLNHDSSVRMGDVIFADTELEKITPKDTSNLTLPRLINGKFYADIDHTTTVSIQPNEFIKIFTP